MAKGNRMYRDGSGDCGLTINIALPSLLAPRYIWVSKQIRLKPQEGWDRTPTLPSQPASLGTEVEVFSPAPPHTDSAHRGEFSRGQTWLRVQRAPRHTSGQLQLCAAWGWPVGHLCLFVLPLWWLWESQGAWHRVGQEYATCMLLCCSPLTRSYSLTVTLSHRDILCHTDAATPSHHLTLVLSHTWPYTLIHSVGLAPTAAHWHDLTPSHTCAPLPLYSPLLARCPGIHSDTALCPASDRILRVHGPPGVERTV